MADMCSIRSRCPSSSVCSLVPNLDRATDKMLRKRTIGYLCEPVTLRVGTYNCGGAELAIIQRLIESESSCSTVWCLQEVCKQDLDTLADLDIAHVVYIEVWCGTMSNRSGMVTLCNAIVSVRLIVTRLMAIPLHLQANNGDKRTLLVATCTYPEGAGKGVKVACTHLEAKNIEIRSQQAREVNNILASIHGPVVLGLDANAIDISSTPPGALSQLARGLSEKRESLDVQTLPFLLAKGFEIKFPDVTPTHWSNSHIDHIIHRTITCTQQRVLRFVGSDHLPVIAEFNHERVRKRTRK